MIALGWVQITAGIVCIAVGSFMAVRTFAVRLRAKQPGASK